MSCKRACTMRVWVQRGWSEYSAKRRKGTVRKSRSVAKADAICRARARALVARVLRINVRRAVPDDVIFVADGLLEAHEDPFGDGTRPRRERERTRRVLSLVWSLTTYWRHRRRVCGQCGEYDPDPETPCGNPCNQCPF